MADKKKIKILLVDDEQEFLDSISERMRLRGFEPTCALNGEEAIELAKKEVTESLESEYFEKAEIGSFWDWIKRLPKKLEDTMAAAGMASHGDPDGAKELADEDEDED
jgi:ActR/RegA family two-component response regulator